LQAQKKRQLHWIKIPVACVCFLIDLATKRWAREALSTTGDMPFIPGFLRFNLVTNTGAAFNLGSGLPIVMATVASVVTIVLVTWVLMEERKATSRHGLIDVGAGFLIGGALGNLADRFMRGRVTDFIEFIFFRFPVFNCADVFIDIGVGLLIIALWNGRKSTKSDSKSESEAESKSESKFKSESAFESKSASTSESESKSQPQSQPELKQASADEKTI
jgi:signal peptidase II